MFWFKRKQAKAAKEAEQEAKIKALHRHIFKEIDQAAQSTRKLNSLLDEDDVTFQIFLATGGDKRK